MVNNTPALLADFVDIRSDFISNFLLYPLNIYNYFPTISLKIDSIVFTG